MKSDRNNINYFEAARQRETSLKPTAKGRPLPREREGDVKSGSWRAKKKKEVDQQFTTKAKKEKWISNNLQSKANKKATARVCLAVLTHFPVLCFSLLVYSKTLLIRICVFVHVKQPDLKSKHIKHLKILSRVAFHHLKVGS